MVWSRYAGNAKTRDFLETIRLILYIFLIISNNLCNLIANDMQNIMADNITKDSRERLIEGVKKVVDVIRPTYGAAGENVIIEEQLPPFYRVTNDGKLIIDSLKLEDPIEQISKNIMSNATSLAEKESGDGRKTTCLLTEAILTEGIKIKASPMDILRSLNECIPIIFKSIDGQKRSITVNDVQAVATISSENENTGKLVQEIYQQIGNDGIIEIDVSNLPTTFYTVTEGVRVRTGYIGKYSETEEGKAVYKNPSILISKEKITSVDQLETLLELMTNDGRNELVLYVEDMDMSVASRLALTHLQGGFKTLIIKAPVLWKDWTYEDIAKLTGATPIDFREGKTFKNISLKDLGTCQRIVVTEDETRLLGTKDISEHIKKLEEMSLTDDQQKVRISWLQTKIAVLKVGGNSDTEINYNLKKARDACSASYHALKDGIVAGGGIALYNVLSELPNTIGGNILKQALKAPLVQIVKNAGSVPFYKEVEPETLFIAIKGIDFALTAASGGNFHGFDAKNNVMIKDMFAANIVDAVTTTKNAIKNAISIAGTNLTAGSVITLPKKDMNARIELPNMAGMSHILQ